MEVSAGLKLMPFFILFVLCYIFLLEVFKPHLYKIQLVCSETQLYFVT